MKLPTVLLATTVLIKLVISSAADFPIPKYVISESKLETMLDDPPSFSRSRRNDGVSSSSTKMMDIISYGRLDYLTGQYSTWASHDMVRNFWGLTESQDYNPTCLESSMPPTEMKKKLRRCLTTNYGGMFSNFLTNFYGYPEGNTDRSNDVGFICAQRRVGRVFGWLHSVYSVRNLPDYLLLVEDDTYINLDNVKVHLQNEGKLALAGCMYNKM